ncbi:hypothetical protein HNY73_010638 [Argiope bruennichi]|uniref:Uncharacterized protein n=1 Tax=Argiope bruennichi TaxID=94029 RepID=A0A8T0F3L4_ARGBR|nr:hypothetical protein HNY73_010638 [Argiope bruennichi]
MGNGHFISGHSIRILNRGTIWNTVTWDYFADNLEPIKEMILAAYKNFFDFSYLFSRRCHSQCCKFFKGCFQSCFGDDRQNNESESIPLNNLSTGSTSQIPSIVINRPNTKDRESPPMYCIPRRTLPSSSRLQPLARKVPSRISEKTNDHESSKMKLNDSEVKCEPSTFNTNYNGRSESRFDRSISKFADEVENRKDGIIHQNKRSPERNIVTTVMQKDESNPNFHHESQIEMDGTSKTRRSLNFGNNTSSEYRQDPYYQTIFGKSIARGKIRDEINRMQATSQENSQNRMLKVDSPVLNIKRRVINGRRNSHLSRCIAQNDPGENLWPGYKTSNNNNQEQPILRRAVSDCCRRSVLKGITKTCLKSELKPLPEFEEINSSEDAEVKTMEQTRFEKVMNPPMPCDGNLSCKIKASFSNINKEKSTTSKREIGVGFAEESLQFKFIKNDINPSRPEGKEEATDLSKLCGEDFCKSKAPIWNLNEKRSFTSKGETEAGSVEDNLRYKFVKNDKNTVKFEENNEMMKNMALKLPRVSLKREQFLDIKAENRSFGSTIGCKYIKDDCYSKNNYYDRNLNISPNNKIAEDKALKLLRVSLTEKQFINNNTGNTSSGSAIGSKNKKDDCNLKNNCNFIKNETNLIRIPAEEKKDNIPQRFLEESQLSKCCNLRASYRKRCLIPNKYMENKVSANNLSVREPAGQIDAKSILYSKKSSRELQNLTMKTKSMGNELFDKDQKMEAGCIKRVNIDLDEPSVRSKNSNFSHNACSLVEDKPRNNAPINVSEKVTNTLEENAEETYI